MIDTLREGKIPQSARLAAAEGKFPIPLLEKLEILVMLASDDDHEISEIALKTAHSLKSEDLLPVLSSPSTPAEVLEFASNQLIFGRKDTADTLLANPALSEAQRDWINQAVSFEREAALVAPPALESAAPAATEPSAEPAAVPGEEVKERITLIQRIARMTTAEKIKTALTGNQEERLALIRDSNKVVSRAVLQSPKISDMEIENISGMKNITEEVLRLIAMSRKFMKSYNVVRSLINNPRTPIDVGLPMLGRLNERDLKGLTLNKNIAEVHRSMATKLIKQKEEANKPKLPGKKH